MSVPNSIKDVTLDWLNSALKELLNGREISKYSWKGEANNGLGAMSCMERMKLEILDRNNNDSVEVLSVIFKFLPVHEGMRNYMIQAGFAVRELQMYTDLFPDFEKFYDERSVSTEFRFRRPNCFYGRNEGEGADYRQLLILEDLFQSGFKMWPSGANVPLNFNQAKPCIKQIALFHAVGIAYKKAKGFPSYSTNRPYLSHHIQSDSAKADAENWFASGFVVIEKLVEKYGSIPEGFLEHLQGFKKNGFYNLTFLEPNEGDMETVCHHDLHINNFMFSEDEKNAVFYDFQASTNCYPMKDLSFFLIQSCHNSFLQADKLQEVIQFYHDVLQKALEVMGVQVDYDFHRIMEEFRQFAYLSALHIIAGAANWYGESVSEDCKRNFINCLVRMFNDGILQFKLQPADFKFK